MNQHKEKTAGLGKAVLSPEYCALLSFINFGTF